MRLLSVDPGAERCGWSVLEPGPQHVVSGIMRYPRDGRAFQRYRLDLEAHATDYFDQLLLTHTPTLVVNETVPAVGGGNFILAAQSYLANVVVTTIHNCAYKQGVPIQQISARTIQSKIAIRGRSQHVTKPQVRNGVQALLPDLSNKKWEWDRWDAIACGLAVLGYSPL